MRGRPLRFIGVVVSGWVAVRVLILWPGATPVFAPVTPVGKMRTPLIVAAPDLGPARLVAHADDGMRPHHRLSARRTVLAEEVPSAVSTPAPAKGVAGRKPGDPEQTLLAAMSSPGANRVALEPAPGFPRQQAPERQSRWSGSAWLIARDGRSAGPSGSLLSSPLLGGSQVGARVTRTIGQSGRLAGFVRADTPLGSGSPAAAAGLQWRAGAAPVTVLAEVRADRAGVAPAIGAFGGGAVALRGGFRLDGYGQVGVIGRGAGVGYGDGQARLTRALASGAVELGVGAWGAAQPGAARFDVGPTLAIPIASGSPSLRVTLDWRQRIAGRARPASGPALSLGTDF
jgi:hypothetical protein